MLDNALCVDQVMVVGHEDKAGSNCTLPYSSIKCAPSSWPANSWSIFIACVECVCCALSVCLSVCPAGEYVAVEYIESILGKNEMVEQIWVYGSSFESVLVAVVVPNKGPLMRWAKEQVRQ